MHLFERQMKALEMTHVVRDFIKILESRIEKIAKYSVSTNQIDVQTFMRAVKIIKRWIRNFAELFRSLTRLTDKVNWRWTDSKQLSFEIIQVKVAIKSIMHEINLNDEVHFYIDSFAYAVDMIVTQFRLDHTEKFVKVFIMYDSFSLSSTRRKYFTYKREFYALVIFVIKYDYLCKHSYKSAIIHTDHRSLTHFLESNVHEKIYEHWVDQLRRLNIVIKYISELRNKMTNDFFRTLFFDENCQGNIMIVETLIELRTKSSNWIWKNDKSDFEKFLTSISLHRIEIIERDIMNDVFVFVLETISSKTVKKSFELVNTSRRDSFKKASKFVEEENIWKFAYEISIWFEDIYFFLREQRQDVAALLMKRSFDYRLVNDILWIHREDFYLLCIFEKKMLNILRNAHDNSDHWAKVDIIAKIHESCYWSKMILNVERYIAECLKCDRHESARRFQSLHFILIIYSF